LPLVEPALQRRLDLDTGLAFPDAKKMLQAMDVDGQHADDALLAAAWERRGEASLDLCVAAQIWPACPITSRRRSFEPASFHMTHHDALAARGSSPPI
jgi:hypothetical protein